MGTHLTGCCQETQRKQSDGSRVWRSFDNSGHRISFPGWQSSPSNIDRTNNILQRIASEFGPQDQVVSAIQPLNEYVLFFSTHVA
jgi:hypothetical protein